VGFCERYLRHTRVRSASECLGLVRSNCSYIIAGNHDLNAAGRWPEYRGLFIYPEDWFSKEPAEKRRLCRQIVWTYEDEMPLQLRDADIEFLRSLPELLVLRNENFNVLLSHFNYPDITGSETRFPQKACDIRKHLKFIEEQGCEFGITGHMHTEGLLISRGGRRGFFSFVSPAYKFLPFGRHNLHPVHKTINIPPVISIRKRGGVTVLDTSDMICEVFQIE
jgi:hypothetical protein